MKMTNGVYVAELDIFIPTATVEAARRLAIKIAAETGITGIFAD